MGVLGSGSIVQHSQFFSRSLSGVSGPTDSGSRSANGDTGESELRNGSIEVRVHNELHITLNGDLCMKDVTISYN